MSTFYEHILVAMDFSEQALKSFDRALNVAVQHEATLHVVSVVNTHSNAAVAAFDESYAKQLYNEYEKKLVDLKQQALQFGVKDVVTTVEYGSPKNILLHYTPAQLIIIGATGLNAVERLVLGSVSTAVLRHAKCDVLITR